MYQQHENIVKKHETICGLVSPRGSLSISARSRTAVLVKGRLAKLVAFGRPHSSLFLAIVVASDSPVDAGNDTRLCQFDS
jgi:hypothetical protein